MNRIRVWFVRTALDAIGGAERVIATVMQSLPKDRFEVSAVWLYEPGVHGEMLQRGGVRTYTRLGRSRFDPRLPLRLIRLAHRERPDIVFTTENALACFWSGMLRRWGLCSRLVIGLHVTRLERRSYQVALRAAAPVADALVTLTQTHQHYWQSLTKLPQERFIIIPNGVDTSRFKPVSDLSATRGALRLPLNCYIVGLVAYLKPVKNLPLFVEVASRTAAQKDDAFFVLVGDGPERATVEQLIRASGLQERFALPGAVDDPAPWHQAFDALLLTSHTEAMPIAILEANSCAVPAVATEVGGVRDVIVHGETGFCAPPNDAAALTEYVLALGRDTALRHRLGGAARQRVIQQFSETAMARRYAELFERLTQQPAAALTEPAPEK